MCPDRDVTAESFADWRPWPLVSPSAKAHNQRRNMTELQSPQRKSFTAKAIFGLLLAVVMVGAFATAGSARTPIRPGAENST